MTWPLGRSPDVPGLDSPSLQATTWVPIPAGRGQWRLTLHNRVYSPQSPRNTSIVELSTARSRKLEQDLNQPATLTFTLNGLAPEAQLLHELGQDVIAWRYDQSNGADVPMFRGVITQAQDQLTEQSYTINITCHDYLSMLTRRLINTPAGGVNFVQIDQDDLVATFLNLAVNVRAAAGPTMTPGAWLPLTTRNVDPSGVVRAASGIKRDRQYPTQSNIAEILDNLAKVINGFDYDISPQSAASQDWLRIFYPYQGILRTAPILQYGVSVSTVDRTVNSGDYANFIRVIGGSSNPDDNTAPPMASEAYNADASAGSNGSVGLWMLGDNASDVTIQTTLDQQAAGDLQASGILVPSYSLGLRPGFYYPKLFQMGDVLPLVVTAGRLNVNTNVRVVGITYDIGDDGQEDVSLTVGRPDVTFGQLLRGPVRDVNALARR